MEESLDYARDQASQLCHCLGGTATSGESNENGHGDDYELVSAKYVAQLGPDNEHAYADNQPPDIHPCENAHRYR